MKSNYAQLDDIRLHYIEAGEGPLMLFVHGFPEFCYAWENQLSEFSKDHHAVALDMRGHNLCDSPAQQEASRYMLWLRQPKAAAKLLENDCARLVDMLSKTAADPRWLTSDLLARYREAWTQPGALEASLNFYRASPLRPAGSPLGGHPPTPEEPGPAALQLDPADFTVRVPTLVIWGERDTALLPGLLDGLEALVPDLTVKRIADGSHWVIHERPDEVSRLIREFLDNPD